MITGLKLLPLAALLNAASYGQSSPAYFELQLPELNKVLHAGNVVADIPENQLGHIKVQLLGSADKNLEYGDVQVRINGKGVGNIFDSGANDRGKYLELNPLAARKRHDAIFDLRENAIEIYAKDKRSREYYQNWIIRSGSEQSNPYFTYVSELSPLDETGLPPDVNIDQPALPINFATTKAASMSVRVKGSAGSSAGISALTLNSKAVAASGPGLSVAFDQTVSVARGQTALVIEASDKKGNRRTVSIPISYPAVSRQPVRMSGNRFALLIGISRFGPAADAPPPITAAAADARLLAATLKSQGFRNENVRLFTDNEATTEQIRSAFEDFTAKAKPDDLLIVFVATHGIHDPAAPEKIYLAGADTQRRTIANTAIELSELQLLLNRALRCRHTLLFFDAEHPLGPAWSFSGKPVVGTHLLNLFEDSAGRSVLVSSSAGQESHDQSGGAVSRGVFAAALAEGLSGSADINGDGVVTPRELCAFVTQKVQSATGGQQMPQYRLSDSETDLPILALGH